MKTIFLIFTIIILLSINSNSQSRDPRGEAEKSLNTFKKLVTEENFRAMGFESVDEINQASLGEPLQLFMVPLDRLQRYQENSDPKTLLVENESFIYPIRVSDAVRSSVSLAKTGNEWKASNFGRPNYAKMLGRYQKENSFVVEVPALNLSFIGMREGNRLMLTPVMDFADFELSAGQTMPAEEVFSRILRAAKDHDGLPR